MPKRNTRKTGGRSNDKRSKVLSRKLLEADLLKDTKRILNAFKEQGLLTYRRIHVMPVLRGGYYTKNRDMCGMEDIQVYIMGGKLWCLELKRPSGPKSATGKQSSEQKDRETELISLGFDYSVIRSIEELVQGLRQRGLTMWSFPS